MQVLRVCLQGSICKGPVKSDKNKRKRHDKNTLGTRVNRRFSRKHQARRKSKDIRWASLSSLRMTVVISMVDRSFREGILHGTSDWYAVLASDTDFGSLFSVTVW